MIQNSDIESTFGSLVVSLLDLTNLDEHCSEVDVSALCKRATTPLGSVAAVCVWPEFVKKASGCLQDTQIKIATVVNFPKGDQSLGEVISSTVDALDNGADEIDLVIPWKSLLEGRADLVSTFVKSVRAVIPENRMLKTILETGELRDHAHIKTAAELAINEGADFIKTSTGKVATNATPEAVSTMLHVIKQSGGMTGIKPSGGIRTLKDAKIYLDITNTVLGDNWVTPENFRFGASSLLDDALNSEKSSST